MSGEPQDVEDRIRDARTQGRIEGKIEGRKDLFYACTSLLLLHICILDDFLLSLPVFPTISDDFATTLNLLMPSKGTKVKTS